MKFSYKFNDLGVYFFTSIQLSLEVVQENVAIYPSCFANFVDNFE